MKLKQMKITPMAMAISIVLILFGGIAIAKMTNSWSTTSTKVPQTYKDGSVEGEYMPADIRGSYTFKEISDLFNIDLQVLYEAFEIESSTDGNVLKTKDLEVLYDGLGVEIGNGSMQVFVALYKDLPISLDDTYLLDSAVKLILEANQNITDEQIIYLNEHSVKLEKSPNKIEVASESKPSESVESENLVKGNTTVQQVLDAGVSKEQLIEILGGSMPPTNQTVKDYCIQSGLEFSTVKDKINSILP